MKGDVTMDGREQAGEDGRTEIRWYDRPRSIRFRLVHRLARLTGGRIRSPHMRASAVHYRMTDAEDNAKSRLAADQHVDTWAVWAVEAYTPANVACFLRSLDALSLRDRGFRERNPATWLRQQRRHPRSSFELYLSKPHSRGLPLGFEVELPPFAQSGAGTIWTATPSLTLLTMHFVLNDDERRRFERILHADHPTRLEPKGAHRLDIFSPDLERERLVAEARAEWSREASAWLRKRFPGLLALEGEGVPTCELTVLDKLVPFPARGESRPDHLPLTALGMSIGARVFAPSNQPDAGLVFDPFPLGSQGRRHSILAMTKDAFESQDASGWGSGESRFLYPLDRSFRPIVAQWAVAHVLDHYRQKVAVARDMLADVVGGRSATRALTRVRRHTAECADAATVARDIRDGVADHSLAVHHAGLALRRWWAEDEEIRLDTALRKRLAARADDLVQDVSELNATLHAQAALLSAHANLRLQPWIIVLAIVSAVAGAIAALTPTRELLGWLKAEPNATIEQKMLFTAPPSPGELAVPNTTGSGLTDMSASETAEPAR